MDKTKIITIVFSLAIISTLLFIVIASKNKSKNVEVTKITQTPFTYSDIVFFYGNTCPHCKETEEWMKENRIDEIIKIIRKEVYDNQENAQNLTIATQKCGLSTDNIGVPFLYAKGKCFVGKNEIINYFSLELEQTNKVKTTEPKEEECCTY